MKKLNKKGMTLVEIMVVLLVASIAMTITCGILVNSLGYFDSNTKNTLDKQAADGISDYIDNEIKYATDVTVTSDMSVPNSKEGWHCIYVSKHKKDETESDNKNENTLVLYRDNVEVFSVDYYSKRNLDLKVKGYSVNKHRLDMSVVLNDRHNKQVYNTKNTYELLNLNMKDDESTLNLFKKINPEYKSLSYNKSGVENYILWYIKDTTYKSSEENGDNSGSDSTDSTGDGTVADIRKNIDSSNYVGLYFDGINYQFRYGDIVWYNGFYWQNTKVNYNNNSTPGVTANGAAWKKLSSEYDKNSVYEDGDIIIYQNKYYYQCSLSENEVYNTSYNPKTSSQWNLIGRIDDPEVVAQVKQKTYPKQPSLYLRATVLQNHLTDEQYSDVLQDPMKSNYKEFVSGTTYEKNSIVKKISTHSSKYYDLWIAGKKTNLAPGTSSSGWIKLDNIYDRESCYMAGDIVYVNDGRYFAKATRDVFDDAKPSSNGNETWNLVNYNY